MFGTSALRPESIGTAPHFLDIVQSRIGKGEFSPFRGEGRGGKAWLCKKEEDVSQVQTRDFAIKVRSIGQISIFLSSFPWYSFFEKGV